MEKINLKVNDIFSQAWKGCQKPMWFRILNIDRITNSIEVECHSFDACDEPRKWIENEGHYKLTKDKFNKLWHLKRDVLTFQRVICLARNRTFGEEDYSPLLNLFLKW